MSRPRRGVLFRARRGERGSVMVTTLGGQQVALAGLEARSIGRVLAAVLAVMQDADCDSETVTRPGMALAMPTPPPSRGEHG